MLGKIYGRKKRGRQKKEKRMTEDEMVDRVTGSMDMSLSRLQELVMDRKAWRAAVHRVTKSWTGLSNWTDLKSEHYVEGPRDEGILESERGPLELGLKTGTLQSMGSPRVRQDWVTEMTELNQTETSAVKVQNTAYLLVILRQWEKYQQLKSSFFSNKATLKYYNLNILAGTQQLISTTMSYLDEHR